MKVLILTFYYSPDLCAGSFRATAFVKALSMLLSDRDQVEVLTTMPNRYQTYSVNAPKKEVLGNVIVTRVNLPKHQSGFIDQSKAFSRYAYEVLRYTRNNKYDLVFATSSRLFTGFLGSLVSKKVNAPLYLDLRDIFTDTMDNVLSGNMLRMFLPIINFVEKHTVKSAKKINLVSKGFYEYFNKISPTQDFTFYTNGIDKEFLGIDFCREIPNQKKIILYAGNIGEGQGLENIIPDAAFKLSGQYEFWVVGDGGRKKSLQACLAKNNITNVKLVSPVNREKLMSLYQKSDYLLLHLNNYDAFKKVLPSKLFEYGAIGKPILAGVSGYASEFTKRHLAGAEVFEPCNADDLVRKIGELKDNYYDRTEFINSFKRNVIMKKMANDFISTSLVN